MITDEDKKHLYALLDRNSDLVRGSTYKAHNIYNYLVNDLLPYYDNSRFHLSNIAAAYRYIILVDNVCKSIGEFQRYPLNEEALVALVLLANVHKTIDSFDKDIAHSCHIVNVHFSLFRNHYFRNSMHFEKLLTSTYSKRLCLSIYAKFLHDINILMIMDPWWICSAWNDIKLLNRVDLDPYNHGDDKVFTPSDKTDEELMTKLWKYFNRYNISNENWHNLYIPEIESYIGYEKGLELVPKTFEEFKDIIDKNEYISYIWPV